MLSCGGVDVGGPVVIPKLYDGRNRTFFFFGYEPLREYTQSEYFDRMATAISREIDEHETAPAPGTHPPTPVIRVLDAKQEPPRIHRGPTTCTSS